jgi:hypothetical protein
MLVERSANFAKGFRMRCVHCEAKNWLTPEDYAGNADAMMTCDACNRDFNFGPAVIALTELEDPALDDSLLPQLAWYHTTTDSEWPRTKKLLDEPLLNHLTNRVHLTEEEIARYRVTHEDMAIHLGTYEAAVDSMLRRMESEDDQLSAFYLHRVRLRSDVMIEAGLRDENSEPAAKITMSDLAHSGVDGIRYLNAHEAIGSISLAVVRDAIESTQREAVPIPSLFTPPEEKTTTHLRTLRDQVQVAIAKKACAPPTRLDLLKQKQPHLSGRPAHASPPPEVYGIIRTMEQYAANLYLDGLSPVARDDFVRSLQSPRPGESYENDSAWLNRFIGLSALMARSSEVQEILRSQPWRPIQSAQPSESPPSM